MEHIMRLNSDDFKKIQSGTKTIETRLWDEKRREIKVGDIISFLKRPEQTEQFSVKVVNLLHYETLKDIVFDLPMTSFGYPENYNRDEYLKYVKTFYTDEDVVKYGVVGIEMELIS